SQTTFNYAGLLPAGNQDTVSLGIFNFATGPYTVKVWTANPNGGADANAANDSSTSVVSISNTLTGTYTIGGATPNFANFQSAVNALQNNGVCGPVIFNMRPMTDTTVFTVINAIPGVDSVNTVTFQSENGDSS